MNQNLEIICQMLKDLNFPDMIDEKPDEYSLNLVGLYFPTDCRQINLKLMFIVYKNLVF